MPHNFVDEISRNRSYCVQSDRFAQRRGYDRTSLMAREMVVEPEYSKGAAKSLRGDTKRVGRRTSRQCAMPCPPVLFTMWASVSCRSCTRGLCVLLHPAISFTDTAGRITSSHNKDSKEDHETSTFHRGQNHVLLQTGCLSFGARNAECDGERADAATRRELAELSKLHRMPSEERGQYHEGA